MGYRFFCLLVTSGLCVWSSLASADTGYTYNSYCTYIGQHRLKFSTDSDAYKSMTQESETTCASYQWTQDQGNAPFPGPLNPYLSTTPNEVDLPEHAKQAAISKVESVDRTNLDRRIQACKEQAAKLKSDCAGTVSQFQSTYTRDYDTLFAGLTSGNKGSVESSCGNISNYQQKAESAVSRAIDECARYQGACTQLCESDANSIDSANLSDEARAWVTTNIRTARGFCDGITNIINSARSSAQSSYDNLNTQCQQARQQQVQNPQRQAKNDDRETAQLLNQSGQAMQMLSQAMQQPQGLTGPQMMPPAGQMGLGYPMNTSGSSQLGAYGVGKPAGPGGRALPSNANGGNLILGDGVAGLPDGYQKSRTGSQGANGGGGGGGQSVGGGSGSGSPNSKNKRNASTRKTIEADVLKGYYSGNESGTRFRMTGGSNIPVGGPGGGGARVPGTPARPVVNISQFAPTWFVRREVATATGPDGITGPHTDLFKKVRTRFEALLATFD